MGKKDIIEHQFKKGNKMSKGRPKKLVSSILASLQEEGELVTRSLVEQTYQVLLSLTQEQLTKVASDKKQPMINRIVAKEMLGKKGFEIIEKMMDRANGKPTTINESVVKVDATVKTDEELDKEIKAYEKRKNS